MKNKHEITIPPIQDFISDWVEKQLVVIVKINWPWWLHK